MNISDFNKRITHNEPIDDNAIGKVMGLLMDMPLEKMYSSDMNHIPETGEYDPYAYLLVTNSILVGPIDITEFTLRRFSMFALKLSNYNDKCDDYQDLCYNLSLWHRDFIPKKYVRKEF